MKPTAKELNTKRQAEFRKRRTAEGLVLLQGIWVPKDRLQEIRAVVRRMVETEEGSSVPHVRGDRDDF